MIKNIVKQHLKIVGIVTDKEEAKQIEYIASLLVLERRIKQIAPKTSQKNSSIEKTIMVEI